MPASDKSGFKLIIAPVQRGGMVDLDALEATLGDDTLLFSIQAANNEIGTAQPLADAIRLAHEHGALVHSDATQAFGKTTFDVEALGLRFAEHVEKHRFKIGARDRLFICIQTQKAVSWIFDDLGERELRFLIEKILTRFCHPPFSLR